MKVVHIDDDTLEKCEEWEYDLAEKTGSAFESYINGRVRLGYEYGRRFYTIVDDVYTRAEIAHWPRLDWPDWFK